MEIEPIDDGVGPVVAAHQPYSIHIVDRHDPRRLGRLLFEGVTDENGLVFVGNVECGDYQIALPGVEETRPLLVLPFYFQDPQVWLL